MPNVVIAGAQWGDEGKGKIVDLLTARVQVVARYNGGHNAGHTIRVGDDQFVLRLIPSGILHPGILCLMGNGMVIDPWAFESELSELRAKGIAVEENLLISDRAHLILPHHRALEALAEELRGSRKIGTTLRGIGPAYEDKAARRGLRMGDLLRPGTLAVKLEEARRHYEQVCRGASREPSVDWDTLLGDLFGFGERLRARVTDVSVVLHRHMAEGYSVLFEGAQATLLDLDHGTYPFVTSSSAIAGGVLTGLGVGPSRIDGVIGIAKAYTTRVGAGPLPSEIGGPLEDEIRARGHEFGANTKRPRRCGWFDAVVCAAGTHQRPGPLAVTSWTLLAGRRGAHLHVVPLRGRDDRGLPWRPVGAGGLRARLRDPARLEGVERGRARLRAAPRRRPALPRAAVGAVRRRDRHRVHRARPRPHDPARPERAVELVRVVRALSAFAQGFLIPLPAD
jgi:adenylosuccinate synthase